MPAVRSPGASVALNVDLLLGCRERWPFPRVETDDDDLVLLARVELQLVRGLQHAVEHKRAKVRTFIIGERENHGLCAEEAAEFHGGAMFVSEDSVERNLRIELLLESGARGDLLLRRLCRREVCQYDNDDESETGPGGCHIG